MKTQATLFFALISVLGAEAHAGPKDSGGGEAVLCYDSIETRNDVVARLVESETDSRMLTSEDLQLGHLTRPPQMADIFESGDVVGISDIQAVRPTERSAEAIYARLKEIDAKFWRLFSP